jgi:hypothetical protein
MNWWQNITLGEKYKSVGNGMDQPNCNYNWKESTNGRNVQVYYFLFAAAKIVIEKYRHSALQPLIFFL